MPGGLELNLKGPFQLKAIFYSMESDNCQVTAQPLFPFLHGEKGTQKCDHLAQIHLSSVRSLTTQEHCEHKMSPHVLDDIGIRRVSGKKQTGSCQGCPVTG